MIKDQFKDFPICINCKYFLPEKSGPLNIIQTCGLTMIDPVTGEFADRASRVKLAAAYRKENMPCGPSGLFFQPGKVKVTPKPKAKVEEVKVRPEAKVVKVDVPKLKTVYDPERKLLDKHNAKPKLNFDGSPSDLDPNGVDDRVTIVETIEQPKQDGELLPLEPGAKRRKRRDK